MNNYLMHHGVKGMHWGDRRYQNPDGTLTELGKKKNDKTRKRIGKFASRFDKRAGKFSKRFDKYAGKFSNWFDKKADPYSKWFDRTVEKMSELSVIKDIYSESGPATIRTAKWAVKTLNKGVGYSQAAYEKGYKKTTEALDKIGDRPVRK